MPKRRNRKPSKQPKDFVDRISNLPIEIIREIHSYLPRKDAGKTCILSKKWRSIWASHPRIFLDEVDFGADYSQYTVKDKAKRDAFLTYLIKSFECRERPCEYNCPVEKLFLRMTVENSSAKMLDCRVEDRVEINSPKLKSLEFKGDFTFFDGIEALQELEFVLLYLDPLRLRHIWYSWFRDMLESCAHSKRLSLICDNEPVIFIPVEFTDILPVNGIKHLELEIIYCHSTSEEIVDDVIWLLPDLETLSLTLNSTTEFIEI